MRRKPERNYRGSTIWLTPDQMADLDRLSAALEVSKSALIRRGVDWAIDWAQSRVDALKEAGLDD